MSLVKLSPLSLFLYPKPDHPLVSVDERTFRYDKTGGKKVCNEFCNIAVQNELKSNFARFAIHVETCLATNQVVGAS